MRCLGSDGAIQLGDSVNELSVKEDDDVQGHNKVCSRD